MTDNGAVEDNDDWKVPSDDNDDDVDDDYNDVDDVDDDDDDDYDDRADLGNVFDDIATLIRFVFGGENPMVQPAGQRSCKSNR